MTNEEMIKNLSRIMDLLDMYIDLNQSLNITQMEVAYLDLKCIVRALEQQPSEDCISREDALDCLTASGLKKFDFILDARDKIKNLPSVTPSYNSIKTELKPCGDCIISSEDKKGEN